MSWEKKCKKCGGDVVAVEYSWDSPEHYDGISEYECLDGNCGQREGRWSGKILQDGEIEKRYGRE